MAGPDSSLAFPVRRCKPELVAPAKPTPHEFKHLSDIDDRQGLRFQAPLIQFYGNDPSMHGKDPVKVIREALAQTLVFYYPFAGRLREGPGKKLVVECTGEGVLFVEADADVTLQQFGDTSKCSGFIVALRLNHTLTDAAGLVQFMTAMSELARGATSPTISPVWQRHLLNARDPPRVTCAHPQYEEVTETKGTVVLQVDLVHRSFFFGPTEVSALRRFVPLHLHQCSTFQVIIASVWRCRAIALQPDRDEEIRLLFAVNARPKFNPPLPPGYYGNVIVLTVAITTAGKLCENPLGYALKLVKKAKDDVTEEYMHSFADLMFIKGRPSCTMARSYLVSDLTRAGLKDLDFAWGKPAYSGAPKGATGPSLGMGSVYIPFANEKGENGTLVPLCLPRPAMERFVKELDCLLTAGSVSGQQCSVSRL